MPEPVSTATVKLGWAYRGFDVILLENSRLRVSVIPGAGAKIHEFTDKATDRDLLYHHPRVELRAPVFGANVDDWWTGGIDDAIPTGHPCVVDGEQLPFLGEVWSLPWDWQGTGPHSVTLSRSGVITPLRISKTITLAPGKRYLDIDYKVENLGTRPLPYLWGIHPAVPIGPQTRVDIPAANTHYSEGDIPEGTDAQALRDGRPVPWPLQAIARPAAQPTNTWVHLYLEGLTAGWCAVSDQAEGWGLGIVFPQDMFPSVHVWNVDGGWRGLRCVAVEPWTGWPSRLDQAIQAGTARHLGPGGTERASIRLIAFDPVDELHGFDEEGLPT